MTATLPDVPACWSWPVPPLPQPNRLSVMLRWQAERCAICGVLCPDAPGPHLFGVRSAGLDEDHDHATGDTRGYCCPPCNQAEGRSSAPVFARYRERNPASILGIKSRYHCGEHPDDRSGRYSWESALGDLATNARVTRQHAGSLQVAEKMRALGYADRALPGPQLRPTTPLMAAAERVGLTWEEWYGDIPHIPGRWRARSGLESNTVPCMARVSQDLVEWARESRAAAAIRGKAGANTRGVTARYDLLDEFGCDAVDFIRTADDYPLARRAVVDREPVQFLASARMAGEVYAMAVRGQRGIHQFPTLRLAEGDIYTITFHQGWAVAS